MKNVIEHLDNKASEIAKEFGTSSEEYSDALKELDNAIENDAISDDGWSEAEIRSMNGERL